MEAIDVQKASRSGSRIARNVSATMRAEGFKVSLATRNACIDVATGKQSADQIVKARLAAYQVKKK